MKIDSPQGQLADKVGNPIPAYYSFFARAAQIINALVQSGTTAQRPTALLWIGRPYFDETLGIPIWYDGNGSTGWCDATGGAV